VSACSCPPADDPMMTCRKIVNWRMFLAFPTDAKLPPAARDLIERLLCDVDDRLGTHGAVEIKARRQDAACSDVSAPHRVCPALDPAKSLSTMTEAQTNLYAVNATHQQSKCLWLVRPERDIS